MNKTAARIRDYALTLPGAWEDHPWGETVAKVGKKVFVFMGLEQNAMVTVKLTDSHAQGMMIPGAEATGYGLGKSGWVTLPLKSAPYGVLTDLIEESYRNIAPKKLIAELEAHATRKR